MRPDGQFGASTSSSASSAQRRADPANPKFLLTVWGVGYRFAG